KNGKSFLVPSIADIFFLAIFFYLSFSAGRGLLNDADTGWHIRTGEYILTNHTIPRHDIFSFTTPPVPWTAHEWLAEVIMAALHHAFGLTGIALFFSFLIALVCYLVFRMLREQNGNILIAAVVAVLVISSSPMHWLARPHIFTHIFLIVWYIILDRFQTGKGNGLRYLPLTLLFWVNLHGGFIIGLILLGAYLAGNMIELYFSQDEERAAFRGRVKELVTILLFCILACLANPRGFHILLFPFNVVSNKYLMDHVQEFIAPNFHEPLMIKYLLFILIVLLALSRQRLSAVEMLLVIVFLNMALFSIRHVPLFALIVGPIIVRRAALVMAGYQWRFAALLNRKGDDIASVDALGRGALWPAAGVALVLVAAGTGRIHFTFDPKIKPVEAVEFLKREPIRGNMFNNDQIGDYIIYAAGRDYKVFFDGRSDMYGVARMKEYNRITGFEPGWEKVMEKYDMTWVIFDARSGLSRYLLENRDWRLIYADKMANIFVRDIPQYRYLIDRYRDVKPIPYNPDDDTKE
ncbi:MAG TPA: hypothetical protein VMJ66_15810, partial [Geobacteraceae bacterium]|nr:hypothetical protein [Geobacteraceae bacterium]